MPFAFFSFLLSLLKMSSQQAQQQQQVLPTASTTSKELAEVERQWVEFRRRTAKETERIVAAEWHEQRQREEYRRIEAEYEKMLLDHDMDNSSSNKKGQRSLRRAASLLAGGKPSALHSPPPPPPPVSNNSFSSNNNNNLFVDRYPSSASLLPQPQPLLQVHGLPPRAPPPVPATFALALAAQNTPKSVNSSLDLEYDAPAAAGGSSKPAASSSSTPLPPAQLLLSTNDRSRTPSVTPSQQQQLPTIAPAVTAGSTATRERSGSRASTSSQQHQLQPSSPVPSSPLLTAPTIAATAAPLSPAALGRRGSELDNNLSFNVTNSFAALQAANMANNNNNSMSSNKNVSFANAAAAGGGGAERRGSATPLQLPVTAAAVGAATPPPTPLKAENLFQQRRPAQSAAHQAAATTSATAADEEDTALLRAVRLIERRVSRFLFAKVHAQWQTEMSRSAADSDTDERLGMWRMQSWAAPADPASSTAMRKKTARMQLSEEMVASIEKHRRAVETAMRARTETRAAHHYLNLERGVAGAGMSGGNRRWIHDHLLRSADRFDRMRDTQMSVEARTRGRR